MYLMRPLLIKLNQQNSLATTQGESLSDIESFYDKIKSQINDKFDFCESLLLSFKERFSS